eukprot:Colp12_sorted_trinity150504_noHs@32893
MKEATSAEFNAESKEQVVVFMPEISKTHMGGTMRLGKRRTIFKKAECITRKLYGDVPFVEERHRHRYEVNPALVKQFEEKGMEFVGQDEEGERMEIMELKGHPYFVAVQYHPEYLTRPLRPAPVFTGLILASAGLLEDYLSTGKGVQRYNSSLNVHPATLRLESNTLAAASIKEEAC